MKTTSLLASVTLALALVSAAHAQVYVRAAVVARPAYGRVVYAYNYPLAPVVVGAAVAAPVTVAAAPVYYPAPAVEVVAAPAPAVVVAPRGYWAGWYGWGPRYYGRGYFWGGRPWRR
jgi:hypothetical protein